MGFGAFYDFDLGILDFTEAEDPPFQAFSANSTFSGFSFVTAAAPGTAFTTFAAQSDADVFEGSTNLVPEPSTSLVLGLAGILLFNRRKRHA